MPPLIFDSFWYLLLRKAIFIREDTHHLLPLPLSKKKKRKPHNFLFLNQAYLIFSTQMLYFIFSALIFLISTVLNLRLISIKINYKWNMYRLCDDRTLKHLFLWYDSITIWEIWEMNTEIHDWVWCDQAVCFSLYYNISILCYCVMYLGPLLSSFIKMSLYHNS